MILVDENDEELGIFKVDRVAVINEVQYASIKDEFGISFCRVIKDHENKTGLADIVEDDEFLLVQSIFASLGAVN